MTSVETSSSAATNNTHQCFNSKGCQWMWKATVDVTTYRSWLCVGVGDQLVGHAWLYDDTAAVYNVEREQSFNSDFKKVVRKRDPL